MCLLDLILDLALTSESGMIEEVQVKEHLSASDHNILIWHLKCETKVARSEMKKFTRLLQGCLEQITKQ